MKNKTIIIAEAGVNHNGKLSIAKKLINLAKDAGADIIKFQTFKSKNLVIKKTKKAKYQTRFFPNQTQYEMLKKLELNFSEFKELKNYCSRKKIEFLSSPFDLESVKFLKILNLKRYKIASGEITNYPLLRLIGSLKKKVILSSGMSTLKDIKNALSVIIKAGTPKKNITILHCNSAYPTPEKDVNLKAMLTIKEKFGIEIGYSDHTLGIEVPMAAVSLGAKIIEKHITLKRDLVGPDHQASLEPNEFKKMVFSIRKIEKCLGTGMKTVSFSERCNKNIVRKSIFTLAKINKGDVFSDQNLTTKRPGNGISPMLINKLIGKKSKHNYKKDKKINFLEFKKK